MLVCVPYTSRLAAGLVLFCFVFVCGVGEGPLGVPPRGVGGRCQTLLVFLSCSFRPLEQQVSTLVTSADAAGNMGGAGLGTLSLDVSLCRS